MAHPLKSAARGGKLAERKLHDDARLTLRIDFGPYGALGPGKVALMEGIAKRGSISAAGKDMGMSYRRAWCLADEINRMFSEPLIEKKTGGSGGGGACLSKLGQDVVDRYRAIELACANASAGHIRLLRSSLPKKPNTMPQ